MSIMVSTILLGRWARAHLDPPFEKRMIPHQYALLARNAPSADYLISARDRSRTVFEARRVMFALLRVTPVQFSLLGQTGLLERKKKDPDDRWAERLGAALREIGLEPAVLHGLRQHIRTIDPQQESREEPSDCGMADRGTLRSG
jgi:hypothetical protein